MSLLFPFRALRPAPRFAAQAASVPYDVVNTDEARALADGNPLSFLRVTRAELELPAETNPYDASVYVRAAANLSRLQSDGTFVEDAEPSVYLYRLKMGSHVQTGVAACFSVDEYDRGLVKKHEKTRPDKEDDRTRHIIELRAQTGLVFLVHRRTEAIADATRAATAGEPLYDFAAPDGVVHTIWRATGPAAEAFVRAFAELDSVYIADGHHRAASASRARQAMDASGRSSDESGRFVAVAFPDEEVQILPYNRIVRDLHGHTAESFVGALRAVGRLAPGGSVPEKPGEVSVLVGGRWYLFHLPQPAPGASRADSLDVEVLQQRVLAPVLGIGDPRTDKRIDFVGGIRGPAELERLVSAGRAAVAFSMYPVGVSDLMRIADAGGIMPPKSTWFEPKLRDGLIVHKI
jgi:uncharacterized protein (DUF1015 family)